MPPVRPCPTCGRHVLAVDVTCPHCGADAPRAAGLKTAAGIALGLVALAGCPDHGNVDYGSSGTMNDTGTPPTPTGDTGV